MNRLSNIMLTAALLLGLSVQLGAQQNMDAPKLKEVKGKKLLEEVTPLQNKKGLWGYANSEGKFTIKPVFNEACPFEGRLARVCVDGKWGTISNTGLYVVSPIYESISEYSADSLAIVKYNGKFGLIDGKGKRLQKVAFSAIDYADYGYLSREGDRDGTIDKKGNTSFTPQFDKVVMLEKEDTLDMFFKDGKWGVMRAGRDILAHKWEKMLTLLHKGTGGQPNLYLATQNRHYGVVTSTGEYVVPCIYDDIVKAISGEYYVTMIGDKYGAINLKMEDLIAPILDEKPYIGEDIYRIHDEGRFTCVNVRGAIDFRHCADLYNMFKPDEYVTTTTFPQWAKTHLIDENLVSRQTAVDVSRRLSEVMEKHGYDTAKAKYDGDMPQGVTLSYPASDADKYGVVPGGRFVRSSGTVTDYESGSHNVLYKAEGQEVYLVSEASSGEYYISLEGYLFPISEVLENYNVKQCKGVYPKAYTWLPNDRLMVSFAFVRTPAEASEPLIEPDQYKLPAEMTVNIHTGSPVPAAETHAAVVFHADSLSAVAFSPMPDNSDCRVIGSKFNGFYTCAPSGIIADMEHSLRRYDRNGVFDWEYRPAYGEVLLDIEETENYIYLCGSTESGSESGVKIPLLVQLSKRGQVVRKMTKEYADASFTGLKCRDYLLYVKTDFKKEKPYAADYFPHYVLEDFADNVGVRPSCAWEQWGDAMIGGCGLVSHDGTWLNTPVLSTDQMCAAFDWEFSGFTGECLIVRHMGKYGVVNKAGVMTVDAKYDLLEALANPAYIKAEIDDMFGVIDAEGRVIVPLEYDFVGNMSEDIIVVSKDGLYGCFDKDGKLVIPLESEEIREYVGGMARVRQNRKFGFMDKNGQILVNPFSDEVENFSEGCALVTLKDKKGFVTLQGDWITAPMYDGGTSFSGGMATLSMNGKHGYIDKSGEFVIPMKYTDAKPFNPDCRMAAVAMDGKWGVVKLKDDMSFNADKNASDSKEVLVLPTIYDEIVICSDGFIYAMKDGKCGIFSNYGREVYPMVCEFIDYSGKDGLFTNGAVTARIDGELIRIDRLGNTVYPYSKFGPQK